MMQSNENYISCVRSACAACKHNKKKCSCDCPFAPYFPASKNREFKAVHEVYGTSKVEERLCNVTKEQRKEVVESLIWEAQCRESDPVQGSFGVCKRLKQENLFWKNKYESLSQLVHNSMMQEPMHPPVNRLNHGNNGLNSNEETTVGGEIAAQIDNGLSYDVGVENLSAELDSYGLLSAHNMQPLEGDAVLEQKQQQQRQPQGPQQVMDECNPDILFSGKLC